MKSLSLVACLLLASVAFAAESPPAPPAESPPAAETPPAKAEKPPPGTEDEEEDLLPGEKGSADNNVSFPVDI